MKRLIQVGLLLALCAAFAPRSEAREITFAFEGEVTGGPQWVECNNLPTAGAKISGTYTFESTTASQPNGETVVYLAVTGGSCAVGQISSEFGPGGVIVGNDIPSEGDRYEVLANMPSNPDPCAPRRFTLYLDDLSGNMLSSTALPLRPPSIPTGQDHNFTLDVGHDDQVYGLITSLTLVSQDTTGPTIRSVVANPNVLWPANNKLVAVTVAADIVDDDSGVASANLAIDDEYNQFDGVAPMTLDVATGLWTATIQLRAERKGNDKTDGGRIYMLKVRANDAAGNVSDPSEGTQVLVPHDQRNANGKK